MNRTELIDAYVDRIIDGMDMKDLIAFAYDVLHSDMEKDFADATDEEVRDAIAQYYPDLLEEN